jgi:AraC family transcriptional regulator of adaptative response/methylated-DNA-[protein]-cysteine methyltransferase
MNDDEYWRAVATRDPVTDGKFFYAVRTTGIFCRNVCSARLPLRKNVRFFATCKEAEAAGFRACHRCRPKEASLAQRQTALIARACRTIEGAESPPRLAALARSAGLSTFHFHRLFKAETGLTPKAYASAQRARRLREELLHSEQVTKAAYNAGFASSSRFYAAADKSLGMPPVTFREKGRGMTIRFAIGECWLGAILVAATSKGVCAILLGDDPEALLNDLHDRFAQAELIGGDASFEHWVADVVGFVDHPARGLRLPLDIQGTVFQQRVWQALQEIPVGSTVTYTQLAQHIGRPTAIRAVASACAANPIAVAIPCHRVVRTDGSLSGYRWGIDRKRNLLDREAGR